MNICWTPPAPQNVAHPPGLPDMGRWMYQKNGQPADWLGMQVDGHPLQEPVNVVIVDTHAASGAEATQYLEKAFHAGAYKSRIGHSGGYRAWLQDGYREQLPHTFSNNHFIVSNNHGRVFGPVCADGAWIFVGAFSREHLDKTARPGQEHQFESFNAARNDAAAELAAHGYHIAGSVPLDNATPDTGDHDGKAVLLSAD